MRLRCARRRLGGVRVKESAWALAMACLSASAWAQDTAAGRAVSIVPTLTVTETLTDNPQLRSTGKAVDSLTQVTAGLRVSGQTGRVQGTMDYALTGYLYAREQSQNGLRNSLSATGRAELVEDWLSLDATASIAQVAESVFGNQSIDPALAQGNRTEVRSYQIGPTARGAIGNLVNYQATLNHGASRTNSTVARGNSDSTSGSLVFSSRGTSALGWAATLSSRQVDYEGSRSNSTDSASLSINYRATPELRVSASAGHEATNTSTLDKVGSSTWGLGADWSPSERTRLNAQLNHRFFGNSYQLSFDHRMPRSIFRLTASRDISNPLNQGSGGLGTTYDLLFAQLASTVPDPVERDLRVRALLQASGLTPGGVLTPIFLAGAATLQQRFEASFSLQGVRSNVALSASTSTSRRLDPLATGVDDLSTGNVNQRAITLTLGHRLTPVMGVSVDLSRQDSSSTTTSLFTSLRSVRASLTTTVGPRSTASLSARHVSFASSTAPYSENALIATFGMRF